MEVDSEDVDLLKVCMKTTEKYFEYDKESKKVSTKSMFTNLST